MSETPPPPSSPALPPPFEGEARDADILPPPTRPRGHGALAPLRLDLGLHGVPGLVPPGEAADVDDVPGAPKPPARLSRADAALAVRLFRRRAPLPLTHEGRTLRCVLLPAAAAPASDGPWLSLTLGGQPAALRLGWNLVRKLAGVPLDAVQPEDRALILEDALTPWLDAAEALLGVELRFLAVDRKPPLTEGTNLALGVEVAGDDATAAARRILLLRLDSRTAATLAAALDRWTRPREVLDGLWLRAAVEVEAARLPVADIASLQIGDALLIEGGNAPARIVVEEQLVAPAVPAGGPGAAQATWRLTDGFAPRGPLADHGHRPRPARAPEWSAETEGTMSDSDDRAQAPDPAEATADATPDTESAAAEPEAGAAPATTAPAAGATAPGRDPLPSLDRLEVRLSIRMGETLMTLADLRQAGPGTILTLDRPDGALVEIVANGQPIGTGEIISVSGQRAVEIRTLFADG